MAAEQVQIRRDSNTNLVAATPAQGELGCDTTNARVTVGDGSKAGGHPLASWQDVQGQKFTAATSSGTDTITLTLDTQLAPAAYATRQRFAFIAGSTNTGAATININALGAKTIKKNAGGALADVEAGDITSGRPYDIMYDGTYFVLLNAQFVLADAASGNYVEDFGEVDPSRQNVTTTPTKVLEFIIGRAGTYNVRLKEAAAASGSHRLRIYKNGAAEGTQRNSTGSETFWNEDITVARGDLLQLYAWAATGTVDIALAAMAIMSSNPYHAAKHYNYTIELF